MSSDLPHAKPDAELHARTVGRKGLRRLMRQRAGDTHRRRLYFGAGIAGVVAVLAFAAVLWHATRTSAAAVPGCTGARSISFSCFAARYEALTRGSGSQAALDDLAAERATNGYLIGACHQLTHVIGRTAGKLYGEAAFTQGSDTCASGFYHGVVEAVMMRIGPERIVEQAQSVCAAHRGHDGHDYLLYNCVHGMGHGFMAVYGTDTFRALAGCDALADEVEQHHCYGGVFMENMSALGHPERPSSLRPDQPLYPCTAVATRYKGDCYVKQTAYAVFLNNDDFGAVFRLCRDHADPEFRTVCYQGIGGDAAIKSSKFVIGAAAQAATTRQLCLLGPDDEARSSCIVGAVTTSVRDLEGDDRKARALCAALDDHELAAICETARAEAGRGVPAPEGAHHHH